MVANGLPVILSFGETLYLTKFVVRFVVGFVVVTTKIVVKFVVRNSRSDFALSFYDLIQRTLHRLKLNKKEKNYTRARKQV